MSGTLQADRVLPAHRNASDVVVETSRTNPFPVEMLSGVSRYSNLITPTVTVSTPSYSIADNVGGKIILTNAVRAVGGSGQLQNMVLVDRANVKPQISIFFFSDDPTSSTLNDNVAMVVHASDENKLIGMVRIVTADWLTVGGKAYASVRNLGMVVKAGVATQNIFAAINVDVAFTFLSTSDLQMRFGFLQD